MRERWLEDHVPTLLESGSSTEEVGDRDSASGDEEEVNLYLLDPTQWKGQDHYAILGLAKLRYKATTQDIKKACECVVSCTL